MRGLMPLSSSSARVARLRAARIAIDCRAQIRTLRCRLQHQGFIVYCLAFDQSPIPPSGIAVRISFSRAPFLVAFFAQPVLNRLEGAFAGPMAMGTDRHSHLSSSAIIQTPVFKGQESRSATRYTAPSGSSAGWHSVGTIAFLKPDAVAKVGFALVSLSTRRHGRLPTSRRLSTLHFPPERGDASSSELAIGPARRRRGRRAR